MDPDGAGEETYRFLIAMCDFHDPAIFRELRRPEKLLHAVPGDIIRVELDKLQNPGLMVEGTLHGEVGSFPASRSYVLPMGEFVRSLEDCGARDPNELKFKEGDLILPLGPWDGNAPEYLPSGSVVKGRLITPSGPVQEGWFSECSADLVMNHSVFRVKGENLKRKLFELWYECKDLIDKTDLDCIPLLTEFQQQLDQLVGSRKAFRLRHIEHFANLGVSRVCHIIGREEAAEKLLIGMLPSLDRLCEETPNDHVTQILCIQARCLHVIHLRVAGNRMDEMTEEWKKIVNFGHELTFVSVLWKLATFAFLEVAAGSPDSATHVKRLEEGIEEAKMRPDSELALLALRTQRLLYVLNGEAGLAIQKHLQLISRLESAGRASEVLTELVSLASGLLYFHRDLRGASAILSRFFEVWNDNVKLQQVPEIAAFAYRAHSLRLETEKVIVRDVSTIHGIFSEMRSQGENREHFKATITGAQLKAVLMMGSRDGEFRILVEPGKNRAAGKLRVIIKAVGKSSSFSRRQGKIIQTIEVQEKWESQLVNISLTESELKHVIKCKIYLTAPKLINYYTSSQDDETEGDEDKSTGQDKDDNDEIIAGVVKLLLN